MTHHGEQEFLPASHWNGSDSEMSDEDDCDDQPVTTARQRVSSPQTTPDSNPVNTAIDTSLKPVESEDEIRVFEGQFEVAEDELEVAEDEQSREQLAATAHDEADVSNHEKTPEQREEEIYDSHQYIEAEDDSDLDSRTPKKLDQTTTKSNIVHDHPIEDLEDSDEEEEEWPELEEEIRRRASPPTSQSATEQTRLGSVPPLATASAATEIGTPGAMNSAAEKALDDEFERAWC
ncbi:hypothetical protein QBC41DRAFT_308392 [Cercophora samala]|uniref:Uncharacterized protein n=1 Tax=Cercophora samala TaxID=330535 RepID=A0AA39YM59_9PEZI|nr:hypothetical protein QBC41DRAFT_308392 [Cercophora samala]